MKNWIDTKSIRDDIINLNTVAKSLYSAYTYADNIVIPFCMDNILEPELFSKSLIVKHGDRHLEFLDNCIIWPEALNKALRNKCYNMDIEDNSYYLSSDRERYEVSTKMTLEQLNDRGKYMGMTEFMRFRDEISSYDVVYTMTDDVREQLINYETVPIYLGHCSKTNQDVTLVATLRLFPTIKKDCDITIFSSFIGSDTKHTEDLVYDIIIRSQVKQKDLYTWSLYTKHAILNI